MPLPVVAIVGRPNVGKSSLLNALAGKLISIVQDMPGVTRDRISFPLPVPYKDEFRFVELMDTGGYGFDDPTGLTEHIRHQIDLAMGRASLVLFIVDCQAGLTSADEMIAAMLRERGIKAAIVANKSDGEKADLALGEFSRLGLGTPIGVSALNHRNLDAVFTVIAKNVNLKDAPRDVPPPEMMVAIVGKRNAGKSTLVNAIARTFEGDGGDQSDRVIVSEVPGTTRDSVDVRFEKDGQALVVIDTAGVRKKRHMVNDDIEFYSFHRAERSIRRADVVLMLIDATEPVSEPDKKLASYIAGEFKPVVLVVNKWDLAKKTFIERARDEGTDPDEREMMEEYRKYLDAELRHVDYAPIAFITAKDGKNVQQVVDLAKHLHKQSSERIGTGRLNAAIEQIFGERTPSHWTGKRPRVYYATQTGTNPPHIVLFVNNPTLITETYQRFVINRFRELLPYAEVPIKLAIRGKAGREAANGKPVWDGSATGKETVPKKRTGAAPRPGKSIKRGGKTARGGKARGPKRPGRR
jgi:GTP-binding protein